MPKADLSLMIPEFLPRPTAGWRKLVRLDHPATGLIYLPAPTASWKEDLTHSFTRYAKTPASGPYQKNLHARGTKEISWSVSGDLTQESVTLLNLLKPSERGVALTDLQIRQGTEGANFTPSNSFAIPWESVSFQGAANALITYSLSGRSTETWDIPDLVTKSSRDHVIPSWASGNDFVKSWSITHSVGLTPNWENNLEPLPRYYRSGMSEWQMQFTTVRSLQEHSQVKFVFGDITLVEAIVTSREFTSGDRTSGFTYSVGLTNARFTDTDAYQASALTITVPLTWPEVNPHGI
jgi:hypothetical protein